MIAAIPYYELRMVEDGVRLMIGAFQVIIPTFGIPIDPWALLVCLGVLLGLEMSRARAIRMGLDVRDLVDGAVFTVLLGFFFAHAFTLVFYHPDRLFERGPLSIFTVWTGFSSTGGFIGGVLGIVLFYKYIRPRELMRFADLIAYGFPLGWLFGRLGCAVVHDHIGAPTDFFLGVHFPRGHYAAGVRHELGLYEFLLTIPVLLWFLWMGRKDRPPGTFLGWYFVSYAPIRFGLDFLRHTDLDRADARYFGLTPAQYGMFALLAFGVFLLWRRDRMYQPWALDGQPHQRERARGLPVPIDAPPPQDPPPQTDGVVNAAEEGALAIAADADAADDAPDGTQVVEEPRDGG